MPMKHVGILYQPKRAAAVEFSLEVEKFLSANGIYTWRCSAWEPEKAKQLINGTDLLLSIGGDGTILRAARTVIPESIPILGINLGRLGFMAELKASEAINRLSDLLNGKGWIEKRAIIEAEIPSQNRRLYALNEVFVGRRSSARLVNIDCKLNGIALTTYRADGIIVATASGSTGYSLATGGPVLHPQAKEMLLLPVCAHFTFDRALVLPTKTKVELQVTTSHEAMISFDGQTELQLNSRDKVKVKLSAYTAKFLRLQPSNYFYKLLDSKLKRKIK
ncbi:NAD(+)/NADH kinase [Chloroflexota bacterium]